MFEIPKKFKGTVELDASEGFLKGAFVLHEPLPSVNPTFHVTQKGMEIRWNPVAEPTQAPKLINRLFRAVSPGAAKKEPSAPVPVLCLSSPQLAQAFREGDHVQIDRDSEACTLAMACSRQGQLAFALGQIELLLPLKGAANLLFETLSASPVKDHWLLRTSLRELELRPGRTTPLGYYNLAAMRLAPGTPTEWFWSILRNGVSLSAEDLKRIVNDWDLLRPA